MEYLEIQAQFRDWYLNKSSKKFKELFTRLPLEEKAILEASFYRFFEIALESNIQPDKPTKKV